MQVEQAERAVIVGLLLQAALCRPLWVCRAESLAVGELLYDPVSAALSAGWVASGLVLLWRPRGVVFAALFWGCLLALIVLNPNRLQPWVWFYALAWLALRTGRGPEARTGLGWLLAGVYFWSGLSKCSPWFAEDNWPWFCEAFAWSRPLGQYPALGYAAAGVEALFGPLLLLRRLRPFARPLVVVFHLYIIAALSPLGHDWNAVVIPWNLCMAWLVWRVFSDGALMPLPRSPLSVAAQAAGVWAPALYYVGCLPIAFAWAMYSNTQPEAGFYVKNLPPKHALWTRYALEGGKEALFDDFSMALFRTPILQTESNYRATARMFCEKTPDESGLRVLRVHRFRKARVHVERKPCEELGPLRR